MLMLSFQLCAAMDNWDSQEDQLHMRDEWRSARTSSGEQSVTTPGIMMLQLLCVHSLATLAKVSWLWLPTLSHWNVPWRLLAWWNTHSLHTLHNLNSMDLSIPYASKLTNNYAHSQLRTMQKHINYIISLMLQTPLMFSSVNFTTKS